MYSTINKNDLLVFVPKGSDTFLLLILILCHEMHLELQIEKFRKNLKEPKIRLN